VLRIHPFGSALREDFDLEQQLTMITGKHWCNLVLLLFTGNTSKVVTLKPIHALKMKHV
jgi:hypothetical protein